MRLPDAPQTNPRVALEFGVGVITVESPERLRENIHIRHREIHTLCSGWWDDVSGVAGEEEFAKLHWLGDVAPHAGNTLLQDLPLRWAPAVLASKPREEFAPDPVVAPKVYIFIRFALQVEARHGGGAHAVEGEAAIVMHVNKFIQRGRRLCENP